MHSIQNQAGGVREPNMAASRWFQGMQMPFLDLSLDCHDPPYPQWTCVGNIRGKQRPEPELRHENIL